MYFGPYLMASVKKVSLTPSSKSFKAAKLQNLSNFQKKIVVISSSTSGSRRAKSIRIAADQIHNQGFGSESISCGSRSRVLKMDAYPDPDANPGHNLLQCLSKTNY